MRLLFESESDEELTRVRQLLEARGIPVFISSQETYRVYPAAVVSKRGLWVCVDKQFRDAAALLENPEHLVAHPVDIEAFHRELELVQKQPFTALGFDRETLYRLLLIALAIGLLALAVTGSW